MTEKFVKNLANMLAKNDLWSFAVWKRVDGENKLFIEELGVFEDNVTVSVEVTEKNIDLLERCLIIDRDWGSVYFIILESGEEPCQDYLADKRNYVLPTMQELGDISLDVIRSEELEFSKDFYERLTNIICDHDLNEDVFWNRIDGKIRIYTNSSDLFWWAYADCVEITEENIELLEQSLQLCKSSLGVELFACRMKKMRPQGAYYKYIPKELKKYFDECGPEREPGFGNPHDQHEYDED